MCALHTKTAQILQQHSSSEGLSKNWTALKTALGIEELSETLCFLRKSAGKIPFRQVLSDAISCPLIWHRSSTVKDILPKKRHKSRSISVLNHKNKALIASLLDPSKTPLMWNKPFLLFFCEPKLSHQSWRLCLVRIIQKDTH